MPPEPFHVRPCPLGPACPCAVGVYLPLPEKPKPPPPPPPPADAGGLFAGLTPPGEVQNDPDPFA